MMKVEYSADKKTAFFDGYKFRRDAKTGYYLANKPTYQGKRERLHVYVWRYFNGPVADGYHVHHKDEDKSHNDIDNLECIPEFDHLSLHGKERAEQFYDDIVRNLREKAIPKASERHKSETGRKWHMESAFPVWKMEETEHICQFCGKKYMSREVGNNRFCSNNCKAAARRKSGVDDETRICACCGKEFRANKYGAKRFCSDGCRIAFRRNKRNQAVGQTTRI